MPSRSWAIAALLLPIAFLGCREEHDIRALKEKALSSQNADSRPEAGSILPPPPGMTGIRLPHGGRRIELPGHEGCVEWIHKTGDETARFYVLDAKMQPVEDVSEPSLWLAEAAGPAEIRVEPCPPNGAGNLAQAESRLGGDSRTSTSNTGNTASEPAMIDESGGWKARSPNLAQGTPHGIVRLQIHRQGYRFALPTRPIEQIEIPAGVPALEQPEQPR